MLGLSTLVLIGLSIALSSDELKLSMKNAANSKQPRTRNRVPKTSNKLNDVIKAENTSKLWFHLDSNSVTWRIKLAWR